MIAVQRSLIVIAGVVALHLTGSVEARAQDASEFFLRLNRLENQVRDLSGQVEQLKFENRRLQDQARKFQEDVDFRFQELGGGGGKAAPATPPRSRPAAPERRGDAFDPSADPNAPGAPLPLGQRQSDLAPADPEATGGVAIIDQSAPDDEAGRPLDLSGVGRTPPATRPAAGPRTASIAATTTLDPRAQYQSAVALLQRKQYEDAEMGLRQFLQSNPRDRLVPDATYLLGETYLSRGRYREAAEQYLKVTTDYGKSRRAPDGMLKLAISLNALGARSQACATLGEVDRKYPQASATVRQGVAREQARAKC
ncbi:tol-pal system protein YbgF [Chelatococcus sp. GCM10030263]|uniref:tol-pal system protein YbgF n=1 Tax=Chelatococcus sp. GCM10030263 TaxID=3273387 RepID=UPI0036061262